MKDIIFNIAHATYLDLFGRRGADVDALDTVTDTTVVFHNTLHCGVIVEPDSKKCVLVTQRALVEPHLATWEHLVGELGLAPHVAMDAMIALDWVDECGVEDCLLAGPVDDHVWEVLHVSESAGRIHFYVAELHARLERGAA